MKVIEQEFDLVGLGFGPANLALAIALHESDDAQQRGFRSHFFEKQPGFAWHSSLLLPGAQLQVSPMKDLATMRDPTSSYTFTNYLHKQGRLAAFINREASIPSRREWSAYLAWAAQRMRDAVSYGTEVVRVEPAALNATSNGQRYGKLRITLRDMQTGELHSCLAKNITVGVGGMPVTPEPFDALFSSQPAYVAHSSGYLPSLAKMEARLRATEARRLAQLATSTSSSSTAALRFAVIGSGQSAAEISLHLRKTFPTSHVSLIFRASALVPSDDSAFVNAMAFDPDRTDAFWQAGIDERTAWLQEYRRTNYSVVRTDVLNELHTEVYNQTIEFAQPWPNADGPAQHGQLQVRPNTQVDVVELVPTRDSAEGEEQVALTLRDLKFPTTSALRRNSGSKTTALEEVEMFDAVFLATGFKRSPEAMQFLQPLQTFYPRLDPNAERTKAALGFGQEMDSFDVLASMGDDEASCERLRHRTRGITRDYRLVGYASDAFAPSSSLRSTTCLGSNSPVAEPCTTAALLSNAAVRHAINSGASTPRRGSDISDSDTLNELDESTLPPSSITATLSNRLTGESQADLIDGAESVMAAKNALSEEERRLRGPAIDANVYFLGGNEATHGLSDSLLSIVAHRAGELCASLFDKTNSTTTTMTTSVARHDKGVTNNAATLKAFVNQSAQHWPKRASSVERRQPTSPLSQPYNAQNAATVPLEEPMQKLHVL